MSIIKKLNKSIQKLEKKRFKYRKNAEYHARERDKAFKNDKPKSFEKHTSRENFYRQKVLDVDNKIGQLEIEIRTEEAKVEKAKHEAALEAFDKVMIGKLEALASGLDIFVEELFVCDLNALFYDAYNYYTANSSGFDKVDLKPYVNLGFKHVAVAVGNIIEKVNSAQVFRATRGDSLYRGIIDKPITWAKNLSSQIKDTIKVLKIRSDLQTLREEINGK